MTPEEDLPKRLRKAMKRLRCQEQRFFNERHRLWAHKYLARLYRLSEALADKDAEILCGAPDFDEVDVMRELLARTSSANTKTRSRWLRALTQLHEVIEDEGGTVEDILRTSGGIAGCARDIATPKRVAGVKLRDWK